MINFHFTIPEINLISIYADRDKETTIDNIMTAIPDFDDKEMTALAEGIIIKLDGMNDSDFSGWDFLEQFTDEYGE